MKKNAEPKGSALAEPPPVPAEFDDRERDFDTLEPAWADFLHGARTGVRLLRDGPNLKLLPQSHLAVHQWLEGYRKRYANGDPSALLHAMTFAMTQSVPVPYWAATEFKRRLDAVLEMQSTAPTTLHDAFELEKRIPTTPSRWANARKQMRASAKLYRAVSEIMVKEGLARDPAIRRALKSREYPFGRSVAIELYEERRAVHADVLPRRIEQHRIE